MGGEYGVEYVFIDFPDSQQSVEDVLPTDLLSYASASPYALFFSTRARYILLEKLISIDEE